MDKAEADPYVLGPASRAIQKLLDLVGPGKLPAKIVKVRLERLFAKQVGYADRSYKTREQKLIDELMARASRPRLSQLRCELDDKYEEVEGKLKAILRPVAIATEVYNAQEKAIAKVTSPEFGRFCSKCLYSLNLH